MQGSSSLTQDNCDNCVPAYLSMKIVHLVTNTESCSTDELVILSCFKNKKTILRVPGKRQVIS